MSDLQDLIATNAVKAYNEGFSRGEMSERERIIHLIDSLDIQFLPEDEHYAVGDALDLIEIIKGEQK